MNEAPATVASTARTAENPIGWHNKEALTAVLEPKTFDEEMYSTLLHMEKNVKKRILVVDDDREIVEATRLALVSLGYEVEVALDGSTGLALAECNQPDLMILDMMMPERSGFLVLEALRQIDKFPTRIIMITANEGNRHKDYAEKLGVDAYMRKPFTMNELLENIERVLNEK